jgi:hypothetical protein
MPVHVPLTVHTTTIDIYIFVDHPGSEAKARDLGPLLARMPAGHVQNALARYAIFILVDKPGRGPGGGTWRAREVDSSFRGRQAVTGVADADLALVHGPDRGIVGVPLDRWVRPFNLLRHTVMHEVAHTVDYELGLTPRGAAPTDFRGVRPTCGGSGPVARYSVEAYSRFIINPRAICRDPVAGEADGASNTRVIAALRRTPAFGALPPTWLPTAR